MNRNELEAFGLERLSEYTDVWVELMEDLTAETDTAHAIILRRALVERPDLALDLRELFARALSAFPDAGNSYDALYGDEYGVYAEQNGLDIIPADEVLETDIVLMVDDTTLH